MVCQACQEMYGVPGVPGDVWCAGCARSCMVCRELHGVPLLPYECHLAHGSHLWHKWAGGKSVA